MTQKKAPGEELKEQLGEFLQQAGSRARETADDFEDEFRRQKKVVTKFIKDNPLLSVLGALALGYIAAKILNRGKTIYVEKDKS